MTDDDDQPFTICPTCRERIDPADPALVYGFKQVDVTGFGQTQEWADGQGDYFHPDCFPGLPSYRQATRPTP
jgi:hypothetical protein